jgi:hypothetical protein
MYTDILNAYCLMFSGVLCVLYSPGNDSWYQIGMRLQNHSWSGHEEKDCRCPWHLLFCLSSLKCVHWLLMFVGSVTVEAHGSLSVLCKQSWSIRGLISSNISMIWSLQRVMFIQTILIYIQFVSLGKYKNMCRLSNEMVSCLFLFWNSNNLLF